MKKFKYEKSTALQAEVLSYSKSHELSEGSYKELIKFQKVFDQYYAPIPRTQLALHLEWKECSERVQFLVSNKKPIYLQVAPVAAFVGAICSALTTWVLSNFMSVS